MGITQVGVLPELPKVDKQKIRDLYPETAKSHHGRMRTFLAQELIRWAVPDPDERLRMRVGDPMVGSGTTSVASILEGCLHFYGCDKAVNCAACAVEASLNAICRMREIAPLSARSLLDAPYFSIREGASENQDLEALLGALRLQLLLTSPPFPNSHTQGGSEMQEEFLDSKKTHAGNEFEDQLQWKGKPRFMASLRGVVSPWVPYVEGGRYVLVHVKNHVVCDEEIRVDEWAGESLEGIPGVQVEGYLSVPLGYRSLFQEIQRLPLRDIERVEVVKINGVDARRDYLSCGHVKERDSMRGGKRQARCAECPTLPGKVEVREERVVVARKRI